MSGLLLAIEGKRLSPLRGLGFPCSRTGGFASLHPRLCSCRPFGAGLQTAVLTGIHRFAVRFRNGVSRRGMRGGASNLRLAKATAGVLPPLRGLGFPCFWTGGFALLHPRLYSWRPFGASLQTVVLIGIRCFAVRFRNGVSLE